MVREAHPRLAVILHADVVGSTKLVRRDERLAHRRIQTTFRDLGSLVERYGGTVSEVRGDAFVAEFARASDAVLAALAAQEANRERLARLEDDVTPVLRIGIALGEVIIADATVTGAGVVLAQRLEQFAEPGGICVSGAVREAVPERLSLRFETMGEREIKGFDEPVPAYSVCMPEGAPVLPPQPSGTKRTPGSTRWRRWFVVWGTSALLVAAAVAWLAPWRSTPEPAFVEGIASPVAGGYPSIAVLPFNNLSNDPDQEYFSDGLTEDVITDLSHLSGLLVIARNSTFAYKGQPVNVQQVGRELGARYVLEGSVRRSGGRVRVNAQLIDATTGTHMWADRYDRDLTDVFALQDELTRTIVQALSVNLGGDEHAMREPRAVTSPDAYDALLRGNQLLYRYNAEDLAAARALFQQAIALDPGYARAYANVAFTYSLELIFGWSADREASLRLGTEAIERALALDDRIPQAHFALANFRSAQGRLKESAAATRRAIEIEPNYADAYAQLAGTLTYLGRPAESLESLATAMRLNPRYSSVYLWLQGRALFHLQRFEEAATAAHEALTRNPGFDQVRLLLAATYAAMGRQEEAEWEAHEILMQRPSFSVEAERLEKPYRRAQDMEQWLSALRRAGLP